MLGPSSSSRECAKAMLLNAEGLCEALAGGFDVQDIYVVMKGRKQSRERNM